MLTDFISKANVKICETMVSIEEDNFLWNRTWVARKWFKVLETMSIGELIKLRMGRSTNLAMIGFAEESKFPVILVTFLY